MTSATRLTDLDDKTLTHVLSFVLPKPGVLQLLASERSPLLTVAATCRHLRRVVYQCVVQHCVISPELALLKEQGGQAHPYPGHTVTMLQSLLTLRCGAAWGDAPASECALIPYELRKRGTSRRTLQSSQSELMAALQRAAWLPHLKRLDIVHEPVVSWAGALRSCSALTALALAINEKQYLPSLEVQLPHLAVLHLCVPGSSTFRAPQDFSAVWHVMRAYPALRQLSVAGNAFFADFVARNQAQLQHVTHLELDWVKQPDATAAQRALDLTSSHLLSFVGSCEAFKLTALCGARLLQRVELCRTDCSGVKELQALQALSSLQRLKLTSCKLPSTDWLNAEQWPQLQELELWFCQLNDKCLQALSGCTQLRTLAVCGARDITASGVAKVAEQGVKLQALSIRQCTQLSDADVAIICKAHPTLKVLDAHACRQLTRASVQHVASLHNLAALHAGGWNITDADLAPLAPLPLQRVQLSRSITSACLREASAKFVGSAWPQLAAAAHAAEDEKAAGVPFLGMGHSTVHPVWWSDDCTAWSSVEDAFEVRAACAGMP